MVYLFRYMVYLFICMVYLFIYMVYLFIYQDYLFINQDYLFIYPVYLFICPRFLPKMTKTCLAITCTIWLQIMLYYPSKCPWFRCASFWFSPNPAHLGPLGPGPGPGPRFGLKICQKNHKTSLGFASNGPKWDFVNMDPLIIY